jgi:hypothetical protein
LTRRPYKPPVPVAKPRKRKPDPAVDAKIDALVRDYWTAHEEATGESPLGFMEPIADLRAKYLAWAGPIHSTMQAAEVALADPMKPGAADAINAVVALFNGDEMDSDGTLGTLGYVADAIAEGGVPSEDTIAATRERIAKNERMMNGDPNRPALLAKVDAARASRPPDRGPLPADRGAHPRNVHGGARHRARPHPPRRSAL